LRRVLRLLVSAGVFAERADGRFELTPVGAALRSGPGSMRASVLLFAGPGQWAVWGDLLTTVRTGEPALERVFGVGPFEYFAARPDEAAVFDQAMAAYTATVARVVAGAYDFARLRAILDVGGGDGTLVTGILSATPGLRGATFDLPRLADRARARIRDAGVADRCEFVGGDFFEAVPPGYDAYLLKHVIHDWNDERATRILATIRAAMAPGARVLLIESLYPARIDTGLESRSAAANDCNMMVATGGLQQTEAQFRDLFAAAGLRLTRVIPTPVTCVLEAVLPG